MKYKIKTLNKELKKLKKNIKIMQHNIDCNYKEANTTKVYKMSSILKEKHQRYVSCILLYNKQQLQKRKKVRELHIASYFKNNFNKNLIIRLSDEVIAKIILELVLETKYQKNGISEDRYYKPVNIEKIRKLIKD